MLGFREPGFLNAFFLQVLSTVQAAEMGSAWEHVLKLLSDMPGPGALFRFWSLGLLGLLGFRV